MKGHFERRKQRDFLAKCISHMAMIGWIILISTGLIFHAARPAKLGDRQWKLGSSTTWDQQTGQYMLYMCVAGLAFAVIGLFINILRNRRKRDYIHINLIVLALLSIAGMVLYLITF